MKKAKKKRTSSTVVQEKNRELSRSAVEPELFRRTDKMSKDDSALSLDESAEVNNTDDGRLCIDSISKLKVPQLKQELE